MKNTIATLTIFLLGLYATEASALECQDFSTWPDGDSGSGQVIPPTGYAFGTGWDFYVHELIHSPGDGDWDFVETDAAGPTGLIGLQTYEVTVPVDTDYVYLYIAHYATNPQVEISVNGGSSWTSYSPAPFPPTSPAQPYAINGLPQQRRQ